MNKLNFAQCYKTNGTGLINELIIKAAPTIKRITSPTVLTLFSNVLKLRSKVISIFFIIIELKVIKLVRLNY